MNKNEKEASSADLKQTTQNNQETEKIDSINESNENKGIDDHPVYDGGVAKYEKKFRRNRKFRAMIIITFVIIIGLSIGLGVGYGVSWNGGNRYGAFIGGHEVIFNENNFEAWINNKVNATENKLLIIENEAIIWALDEEEALKIVDEGTATRARDNAEKKANTQIDDEKNSLKTTYGSDWYSNWILNLDAKGYSTEEQYKEEIIANDLTATVVAPFTSNGYIRTTRSEYDQAVIDNDGNDFKYTSDLSQSPLPSDQVNYINEGQPISATNKQTVNAQLMFDVYSAMYKPVAFQDMQANFTFSSSDGLQTGKIIFDSNTTIQNDWNFFTKLFQASANPEDSAGNADLAINGFNMTDENGGTTDGGIQSIGTLSGSKALQLSFYTWLILNENGDGSTLTTNTIANVPGFTYSLNDAIGQVMTDPSSANGIWPGYNGGSYSGTVGDTQDQWDSSITQVNDDTFAQLNTPGSATYYDQIGSIWTQQLITNGVLNAPLTNRSLIQTIVIPDKNGNDITYMSTFDETGWHMTKIEQYTINDGTSSDSTMTISNAGSNMLISDLTLDATHDKNPINPKYDVWNNYSGWVQTNARKIALNFAFTIDTISNPDGIPFYTVDATSGQRSSDYIDASILDSSAEEIQTGIDQFYGAIYFHQLSRFTQTSWGMIDYLYKNQKVYGTEPFDPTLFDTYWQELMDQIVYLQHDVDTHYKLTSFSDLLTNGGNITGAPL